MYIESPRYTERFGSVRINDIQKVVALDSGLKSEIPPHGAMGVVKISEDTIKEFEDKMAIVVPIKQAGKSHLSHESTAPPSGIRITEFTKIMEPYLNTYSSLHED